MFSFRGGVIHFMIGNSEGWVRTTIPLENESIADEKDIDILASNILSITSYHIAKEECLWEQGSLVLDIIYKDGHKCCVKFPYEMTNEQLMHYIKALLNRTPIQNIYKK